MKHHLARAAARTISASRLAWLLGFGLAAGALLSLVAEPAAAMCCACEGTGCGGGFCVDWTGGASECTTFCVGAGCGLAVFSSTATCSGGCSVAGVLPTATPTSTATQIGTPTQTPTHTPSASPTLTNTATPTITPTSTITQTPTITLTPTVTPTPIQCCDCPSTNSCGQPVGPSTCSSGCNLFKDSSCDSHVGGSNHCVANTPTATVTTTWTVTATFTPTFTPTNTPTKTPTSTPTDTPAIPISIDPYKCYRIKPGVGQPRIEKRVVTIVDQFENKRTGVLKPFLICNPSLRLAADLPTPTAGPGGGSTPTPGPTRTATPLTLLHGEAHLVCYKIRDENHPTDQPKFPGKKVIIRNQVEPGVESLERYDVATSNLVCLPSVKIVVP